MPSEGMPAPSRQARWAQQQNEARQAGYAVRLAHWRQVDAQLALAERTAREWCSRPAPARPAGPPLELRPDERVLAVIPALTLVEVSRPPGKLRAEYGGYSARTAIRLRHRLPHPPAESQRVLGHGPVTVTDGRAVFHGPKQLAEWPFDALLRVEHAQQRPVSLLHVGGRKKISGLLCRSQDAAAVRLTLELAVARHRGDLRRLLADLVTECRLHALDRPAPPAPVHPDQAPGPGFRAARVATAVYLGRPGQRVGWRLAQGAAAVLVTVAAVTLAVPDRSGTTSGGASPGTDLAAAQLRETSAVPYRVAPLPAARPGPTREPDAIAPRPRSTTAHRSTTAPRVTTAAPHETAPTVAATPTRITTHTTAHTTVRGRAAR